MTGFTAYLLDPAAATTRPVAIPAETSLETFYRLIGCNCIDNVCLGDTHLPMSMTKA